MTRLNMLLLLVLTLLSANGCAHKNQRVYGVIPTHPLTQAEVDQLKVNIATTDVVSQEIWKKNLELECPFGGREDVIIEEALGQHAFRVSGSKAARYIGARRQVNVTFKNGDFVSIIKSGGRTFVRNMCPKGTVTLVETASFGLGMYTDIGPQYMNFNFTVDYVKDGQSHQQVSQQYTIYAGSYSYGSREQQAVWDISR